MALSKKDIQALIAEFVGMMMFVYTGVGTAHMAVRHNPFGNTQLGAGSGDPVALAASPLLTISLAFGLGITVFAYGTAGYSGGHLNPAVTTSLMILGEITPMLGGLYILAQTLGACVGAIWAALGDPDTAGFALNVINQYSCDKGTDKEDTACKADHWEFPTATSAAAQGRNRMWGPAIAVELMGTFMLVMTVCWTAVSKKSVAGNCAPIAIGLSVFFAHLTCIPVTNCSINPARSFGAAVAGSLFTFDDVAYNDTSPRVEDAWRHMWFFWAFPMLGGALAALTYKFGFAEIVDPPPSVEMKKGTN
jgi:MIP family channel proteins